jgi:hypothetical protein
MSLESLFELLYETGVAQLIRENDLAFPVIETLHVLAIALVVGSIAVVDLRLLGVASSDRAYSQVARDVLPVTWLAFAVAVASGILMFISNAPTYAHNPYFQAKLVCLGLAGINMAIFQGFAGRHSSPWERTLPTPLAARVAALLSLVLWTLIVTAGRWIGFTMLAGY